MGKVIEFRDPSKSLTGPAREAAIVEYQKICAQMARDLIYRALKETAVGVVAGLDVLDSIPILVVALEEEFKTLREAGPAYLLQEES